MVLICLSSTNEQFSFLINKHPTSGMLIKELKRGYAFGMYPVKDAIINGIFPVTKTQSYIIYFKDGVNEVSYKQTPADQFDFMTSMKYNSPACVMNLYSEFLKNTINREHEKDIPAHHSIYLNMIKIDNTRTLTIMKYFDRLQFDIKNIVGSSYRMIIKSEKNMLLREFNSYIYMIAMIIASMNQDEFELSDAVMENFCRLVERYNMPYYIRYLFCSRIITTLGNFQKLQPILEKSDTYNYSLNFGVTSDQRKRFLEKILDFHEPIIDLGCSTGVNSIYLASKSPERIIHAIDIDSDVLEKLRQIAKKRELNNIITYTSLNDFINQNDPEKQYQFLLTEVIEHMSKEEALILIDNAKRVNFSKLIITTPNFEFNQFYIMDGKFRHDDHKWEATPGEFREIIMGIYPENEYQLSFCEIGDAIQHGSSRYYATSGVIIKKMIK